MDRCLGSMAWSRSLSSPLVQCRARSNSEDDGRGGLCASLISYGGGGLRASLTHHVVYLCASRQLPNLTRLLLLLQVDFRRLLLGLPYCRFTAHSSALSHQDFTIEGSISHHLFFLPLLLEFGSPFRYHHPLVLVLRWFMAWRLALV